MMRVSPEMRFRGRGLSSTSGEFDRVRSPPRVLREALDVNMACAAVLVVDD